jgi:DNA-binding transcriptional LysR family regulator
MQAPIDRYFAAHGFEPEVTMRFDNAEFIRAMVRTGLGISMLPLWIVDNDVKQGHLNIIRQAEPPLYSKIALVRRKLGHVPRPVQRFIETARDLDQESLRLLTTGRSSRLPSNRG